MSGRDRLTLAAAFAVALGAAAVVPLYSDLHWLLRALGAVVAVALAGAAARRGHLPAPVQPVVTSAALGYYLCLAFARTTLALGLIPTRETWHALNNLLQAGLTDIDRLAPPVPSNAGLALIAAAGVGAVAVAVDLIAVALGQAAAAGLPLLVLFAVPAAVLPGGIGWIPFVFVAAGWLTLLLVEGGDRVSRWGTPLQAAASDRTIRYDDASLGRVGRRIGVAALGVAVVVPAMIPGLNARLLGGGGGTGDGSGHGTRTAVTYNPIVRIRDDLRLPKKRTVLTYTTDASSPDYLRLTTLDRFNEAGWSSSQLTGDTKHDGVKGTLPRPVGFSAGNTAQVHVKVRIRDLDAQWLPVPAVPSTVQVDGPWLYDSRSETVFGIRTGTKRLSSPYSVTSLEPRPSREALAAAASDTLPASVRAYEADPGTDVTGPVRELTAGLIAKAGPTPYDKVAAIQAFFTDPASGFRYSESPKISGIDSPNALEAFLNHRQGFCEQYASAMAAMIRLAGVPARVAVGFTAGTRQNDGSYLVTTDDAHAWPEAWFAGAGWVRFEPTPRRDGQTPLPPYAAAAGTATPGAIDPSTPAPSASDVPDSGQAASGNPKLNQLDRIENAGGNAAAGHSAGRAGSHRGSLLLLATALLLVLLLLPRLLHVARRRRRWRGAAATAGWQQVREDAADLGHRWRPSDSPRAAAAGLAQRYAFEAEARGALDRLATAAEQSRYARPGFVGDGARLAADVTVVRSAVGQAVSRRSRWRAALLPASTLHAVTARSGTFIADGLDRFDDLWSSVRRLRPTRTA
jgi:transglutaminase-like putative cysteine protease